MNKAALELSLLKASLPEGHSFSLRSLESTVIRPRVGVGCLLSREDMKGTILIGERKGSHGEGKLALPGGHLEFGASWGECASAETEEETSLSLLPSRWTLKCVTNDVMNEEGLHYITIFMEANLSGAEAQKIKNMEPDKCHGWSWMKWKELELKASEGKLFLPLRHFIETSMRSL